MTVTQLLFHSILALVQSIIDRGASMFLSENITMAHYLSVHPPVASFSLRVKAKDFYSGQKVPTWSLWPHCHSPLLHSTCSYSNIPASRTVFLLKISLESSSPRNPHDSLPHHFQAFAEIFPSWWRLPWQCYVKPHPISSGISYTLSLINVQPTLYCICLFMAVS